MLNFQLLSQLATNKWAKCAHTERFKHLNSAPGSKWWHQSKMVSVRFCLAARSGYMSGIWFPRFRRFWCKTKLEQYIKSPSECHNPKGWEISLCMWPIIPWWAAVALHLRIIWWSKSGIEPTTFQTYDDTLPLDQWAGISFKWKDGKKKQTWLNLVLASRFLHHKD